MAAVPVIVFDSNPDALASRVGRLADAVPEVEITPTTSWIAVTVLAEIAPPQTLVLADLLASDRLMLDRPGERLIRRLRRNPRTAHVRPVAWSAYATADIVAGVHRAGGYGFVGAAVTPEREAADLAAVAAGAEVWVEAVSADDAWTDWFERQFGVVWEPWIEPALCRLAEGRDRRAVALDLVDVGAAVSVSQASARMRRLARMVAGENRNVAAAVSAGALRALSQIAAHRPLSDRPSPTLSLDLAAGLVASSPSLVRGAGLATHEVEELLELDALIRGGRARRPARRGAPPADEARDERRWAAGRSAAGRDAATNTVDEMIDGILIRLDESLAALDDARQDELYHPEARAAAALLVASESGFPDIAEVDRSQATAPTWKGWSAGRLATEGSQDVAELRALIDAVDRAGRADPPT